MPGPGKKPSHLKAVAGTSRRDREAAAVVELPVVSEVPDPPDWLPNVHAVKEWQRLAPVLVNNKLLTDAGLMAFGHLCALHGKLVQLWAAGESPTGHMLSQYRALINDFGLTPVAQGKVKTPGDDPKANKFAGNRKKKP
jgi:phage terminase small subunit